MGDCDNTAKGTATRWWRRTPTKGGSLSKNGRARRTLPFTETGRNSQPLAGETPVISQMSDDPAPDATSKSDSISAFLRKVIEDHLDAEHAPKAASDQNVDVAIASEAPETCEPFPAQIPTWKRMLDLTLIVLTYPIWLPVMLIIMAGIKISSPGPIFYRQERVGFGGKRFMIFKFRSMKLHAETRGHESYCQQLMRNGAPMTKLDAGDDRIIPWGRVLRATGLDELPQVFNVLRGEMSLVGPRPCTPLEFE